MLCDVEDSRQNSCLLLFITSTRRLAMGSCHVLLKRRKKSQSGSLKTVLAGSILQECGDYHPSSSSNVTI